MTYGSTGSALAELAAMASLVGRVDGVSWCFVDNTPGGSDARRIRDLVRGSGPVRFIELDNPGFAAACNEAARSSDAKWLLLLNPDVLIDESQLLEIVSRVRGATPNELIAVSMVTRGNRHAGIALAPGWWFLDASPARWGSLIGPSGGAGIYPRERFVQAGGFYESLFAWGEDADLAWRLSREGMVCDVLDLGLVHQGGHSHAGSSDGLRRKVSMLYRNRVLVAKRNLSGPRFLMFCVLYGVLVVVSAPRNARRHAFRASVSGYVRGIQRSRGVSRV